MGLSTKEKVGAGLVAGAAIVAVVVAKAKATPVCTPGERACSVDLGYAGKDLYECSPECKWLLVAANSTECGWAPGEAEFEVTDLVISPSEVYVGESVEIRVLVTNVGGKRGTKTVTLEVS